MRIFINPGHAPDPKDDPGAVNHKLGLKESVVARRIGERVATYLTNVGYEVSVFQFDGLQRICNEANGWGADLFVSIHCNAFDGIARGTETFYARYSRAGRRLAEYINDRIVKTVKSNCDGWDRGTKDAGYYVLMNTDMPAVLVETAFIDNISDAKILIEQEDAFARAIACGITDWHKLYLP